MSKRIVQTAIVLATLTLSALLSHAGNICTWTNAWDITPANTGDVIIISSGGDLAWSNTFPQTVASWTQLDTYTGTVTIHTVYGATGFTNFTVTGDVLLAGGAWKHLTNTRSC